MGFFTDTHSRFVSSSTVLFCTKRKLKRIELVTRPEASSPSVPINCNGAQQSTVDTGMTDGIGSGGSFGMTSESMMVNPDHDDVMFNLGGQEDIR